MHAFSKTMRRRHAELIVSLAAEHARALAEHRSPVRPAEGEGRSEDGRSGRGRRRGVVEWRLGRSRFLLPFLFPVARGALRGRLGA